jgi:hypothetical protein
MTVAPGITAPLGSATVPEMLPPWPAQPAKDARRSIPTKRPMTLANLNFIGLKASFTYLISFLHQVGALSSKKSMNPTPLQAFGGCWVLPASI